MRGDFMKQSRSGLSAKVEHGSTRANTPGAESLHRKILSPALFLLTWALLSTGCASSPSEPAATTSSTTATSTAEKTADEPLRVEGAVKPPELIHQPQPEYTDHALQARIQGVVVAELVIDDRGWVKNVKILKRLPMGLTDKAREVLWKYRYKPATLDGEPVKVVYKVTVQFRLP